MNKVENLQNTESTTIAAAIDTEVLADSTGKLLRCYSG